MGQRQRVDTGNTKNASGGCRWRVSGAAGRSIQQGASGEERWDHRSPVNTEEMDTDEEDRQRFPCVQPEGEGEGEGWRGEHNQKQALPACRQKDEVGGT